MLCARDRLPVAIPSTSALPGLGDYVTRLSRSHARRAESRLGTLVMVFPSVVAMGAELGTRFFESPLRTCARWSVRSSWASRPAATMRMTRTMLEVLRQDYPHRAPKGLSNSVVARHAAQWTPFRGDPSWVCSAPDRRRQGSWSSLRHPRHGPLLLDAVSSPDVSGVFLRHLRSPINLMVSRLFDVRYRQWTPRRRPRRNRRTHASCAARR